MQVVESYGILNLSLIHISELEQLVSTGLTIATALVSWWKNNSFTPEAIEACLLYTSP